MKYPQDIVIEEITENKEAFIELLLIADPSVDMITKYLSKGHLFTMQVKKEVVCAVVVVSDGITAEIKNLVPIRSLRKWICQPYDLLYYQLFPGNS